MYHLFIALQVLGIVLTFGAEVLLLYGDGSREQKLMSCLMGSSLVQNAAYLLELTAQTREAERFFCTISTSPGSIPAMSSVR